MPRRSRWWGAGNPEDEEFVAHFNDGYELDTDFTADLGILRKALDHTESRGSTAFYDAMVNSVDISRAATAIRKC